MFITVLNSRLLLSFAPSGFLLTYEKSHAGAPPPHYSAPSTDFLYSPSIKMNTLMLAYNAKSRPALTNLRALIAPDTALRSIDPPELLHCSHHLSGYKKVMHEDSSLFCLLGGEKPLLDVGTAPPNLVKNI